MDRSEQSCRLAADAIAAASPLRPRTAVVLGSGLGGFAAQVRDGVELPYGDIPHFPRATAPSHAGRLCIGTVAGQAVYVFSGRFHYYEGLSFRRAAFYVRTLKLLGVQNLLLTNAAGIVNPAFAPGDLMLVRDHINFSGQSSCRGRNAEVFGERFFDMSDAYSQSLRTLAGGCAQELGIRLREGVYAFMPGPQYETPAEVRALGILGADAVGMSTAPEIIEAAHCGLAALCVSCLTNYGAGLSGQPLSGDEVNDAAAARAGDLAALLSAVIARL